MISRVEDTRPHIAKKDPKIFATHFLQRFHLLSWPLPFYMMKRLPESLPGCQIDLDSDAEQILGKTICRFGSVALTIVGAKAPVALSFSDQTAQSAVRA